MSDKTIRNRLLAALPRKEYKTFSSKSETFELNYTDRLFAPGDAIDHVYFPDSGIVSLLSEAGDDSSLEVGMIGREGMVGLPLYLGSKVFRNTGVVQGGGTASRMRSKDFLALCDAPGGLSLMVRRFAHSLMQQVSQSAVCFRYHPPEERLARWLLMTADRMRSGEFDVTQKFLSHMLGGRREAVTRCASKLQKQGLIENSRGAIKIIDRKGLETAACSCYTIITDEEISAGKFS